MVSPETSTRLRWHAGLTEAFESPAPSVSSCTWPGAGNEGRLDEALDDFLDALSELNHELNGPVPSDRVADPEHFLSTAVAYSVAEVARMLRDYGEKQHDSHALRGAWLVETAWLAVLAGDIDDIKGHLAEEERARRVTGA